MCNQTCTRTSSGHARAETIQTAFVFSDSQCALDLINQRTTANGSFELLRTIRSRLCSLKRTISVELLWVPAHVGVRGNELADTAAKKAAAAVQSTAPAPGQPLVPLATSKALLRAAMKQRRQLMWLKTLANKGAMQHLSKAPAFFVGCKSQQVILARLRLGHCGLNLSQSRWLGGVDESCDCGDRESVRHFLLYCRKYAAERAQMMTAIEEVWAHEVTEDVLLGGSGVRMSGPDWEVIVSAVAHFVRRTGRAV